MEILFNLEDSTMTNKSTKALQKISEVADIIPVPDALSFFSKLSEAYREDKITQREITKIEAQKDVLIHIITEKYNLYHRVFDRIFDERKQGINKSFEIIDKGIKDKNNELISLGLGSLSKIVSSSPFANMNELSNLLESGQKIDTDKFGTRHRSAMRFCWANRGAVAFVISQDGGVRAITKLNNKVVIWEDIKLLG